MKEIRKFCRDDKGTTVLELIVVVSILIGLPLIYIVGRAVFEFMDQV